MKRKMIVVVGSVCVLAVVAALGLHDQAWAAYCACVSNGKVCGFTGTADPANKACQAEADCSGVGKSGTLTKCETGFTARKTCTGPTQQPVCDPNATSIDCGQKYLCTLYEITCQNQVCVVSGVAGCTPMPGVACGQYGTCG